MKTQKIIKIAVIMLAITMSGHVGATANGKSFFSVASHGRLTLAQYIGLARQEVTARTSAGRHLFAAVSFGGQSTHQEDLARYFLPFNKSKIIVGELGSDVVLNDEADVIANYFGIFTGSKPSRSDTVSAKLQEYTFSSEVSFAPQQTFAGVNFSYRYHISQELDHGIWFALDVPIVWVRNTIGLEEQVLASGGLGGHNPQVPDNTPGTMTAAFKQPSWLFGKIDGSRSDGGLADMRMRFGWTTFRCPEYHLESCLGVIFPTSKKPTSEYLFEPIYGNNDHAGIVMAASVGFQVWCQQSCDRSLYWELDTAGSTFASNQQTRSIDLKNNVWSRYMWVYKNENARDLTPGINVFTQLVTVDAGSSRDLNTAFMYRSGRFLAETGYHFFGREAEKITLVKSWQEGPAIAAIIDESNQFIMGGVSRNRATINNYQGVDNDCTGRPICTDTYRPIQECDLDLNSAAHPAIVAHTVYATLGYRWGDDCRPATVGFGAAYEFGADNTTLRHWMLWGACDIAF